MARTRLVAVALAVSACLGGCSGAEGSAIEDDVAARYEAFPSDAQARGTPPWPEGRLAGDCGEEGGGVYLCFYEDGLGRQGYACFAADGGLHVPLGRGRARPAAPLRPRRPRVPSRRPLRGLGAPGASHGTFRAPPVRIRAIR